MSSPKTVNLVNNLNKKFLFVKVLGYFILNILVVSCSKSIGLSRMVLSRKNAVFFNLIMLFYCSGFIYVKPGFCYIQSIEHYYFVFFDRSHFFVNFSFVEWIQFAYNYSKLISKYSLFVGNDFFDDSGKARDCYFGFSDKSNIEKFFVAFFYFGIRLNFVQIIDYFRRGQFACSFRVNIFTVIVDFIFNRHFLYEFNAKCFSVKGFSLFCYQVFFLALISLIEN